LNQTVKGVPQGGIISPIISNMVLDGLQEIIKKATKEIEKEVLTDMRKLKIKSGGEYSSKIHFVRYADDFIITTNKEEHLKKIMERVEEFLSKRGVELNKEKTKIYKIEDGFDFVGFNIKKYKTTTRKSGEIFIMYPTKKSIQKLKNKIKEIFKSYKRGIPLIIKLNSILRGWGLYYRYSNASRIFTKLDHYIWTKSIKWVRNRNVRGRNSMKNAISKYYIMEGKRKWIFKDTKDNKIFKVFRLETIKILRYILVRNENPYKNPEYFEQRLLNEWLKSLSEIQIKLIKKQKGLCPVCKISLNMSDDENLEIHHIQPREFKGTQTIRNLLLLHKTCHQSVTNCHDPNLLAKYVSEGIIKPLSKRYQKLLDKQTKITKT
jgi:RNA-directed DNA polymerase